MLKLFAKNEALEEETTVGPTTYQFCQGIVEARDSAVEYVAFLQTDIKSAIDTIKGKREKHSQIHERKWEGNGPCQYGKIWLPSKMRE